jgi:hypothetical protein
MEKTLHACFISYRHPARPGTGSLEEKLIQTTRKALQDYIEPYTHDHKVFFDEERLRPGYQYNEILATAICQSACMIILYWPSYEESHYCLKEMKTMLALEKFRRRIIEDDLRGCRLLVPIIFRRSRELPEELTGDCQYLDCSRQSTSANFNFDDDPALTKKLDEIGDYVKTLCDKMTPVHDELFANCRKYTFPRFRVGPKHSIDQRYLQPFPGQSQ